MRILTLSILCSLSYMALWPSGAKANTLEQRITKEALHQGLDPEVAIAVARTESSLNPNAVGKHGEIGLFQIMPYHALGRPLRDVDTNIRVGIGLLLKAQFACKDMGPYWLICYNNGPARRPKYPHLHPYYTRVRMAMQ